MVKSAVVTVHVEVYYSSSNSMGGSDPHADPNDTIHSCAGPRSVWGVGPGELRPRSLGIRLRSLCWDVRPGHAVALGVDMTSKMYEPANSAASVSSFCSGEAR